MNKELEIVKRNTKVRSNTFKPPTIRVELKTGRFVFNGAFSNALKVSENDGLMFAFNKKDKTAFVSKDNEEDSFILKTKELNSLRFSSKDLVVFFDEVFDLSQRGENSFVFEVSEWFNEKMMHSIMFKKSI